MSQTDTNILNMVGALGATGFTRANVVSIAGTDAFPAAGTAFRIDGVSTSPFHDQPVPPKNARLQWVQADIDAIVGATQIEWFFSLVSDGTYPITPILEVDIIPLPSDATQGGAVASFHAGGLPFMYPENDVGSALIGIEGTLYLFTRSKQVGGTYTIADALLYWTYFQGNLSVGKSHP